MPKYVSAQGSTGVTTPESAGLTGATRRPAVLAPVAAGVLAVAALAAAVQPAGAAAPAAAPASAQPKLGKCAAGELCLWDRTGFRGERRTYELSGIDIESCVPLPKGVSAASLANRTGRPVTVYQSRECAETGEFVTHPTGSWAPETAYRGRAFKVWEN
ncbi:hypothetical protein GCM10009801_51390 [Streptomyces albiaxialis]|uniref:Peptidase inhibitor family I36 protein n=1 Tax=Streptomyces albiaxialis TaxID=329523 RepID=A0ABP5HVN6_9ACTN